MLLHFVAVCECACVCVPGCVCQSVCYLFGLWFVRRHLYHFLHQPRLCLSVRQRGVEGWGGKGVSWVRNSVLRKCACGDTQFQFMNVNIYVLISNNATSEILMKYKQNVSAHHTPQIQSYARTLTQISSPTHTQRESSAHAGKHRHS